MYGAKKIDLIKTLHISFCDRSCQQIALEIQSFLSNQTLITAGLS